MKNICDLPEEVWPIILEYLDTDDLLQYQKVSAAWYPRAHLKMLKKAQLYTHFEIEQFKASIDYNPKPFYLNAVQSIYINIPPRSPAEYQLDPESIEKLFYCFPNLEEQWILKNLTRLCSHNSMMKYAWSY